MNDYFAFQPYGYQFVPSYKDKIWDGYIRLFKRHDCKLYSGLLPNLIQFMEDMEYEYEILNDDTGENDLTKEILEDFLDNTEVYSKGKVITPRDYQRRAFIEAFLDERKLFLSPTASGKSLIIYFLYRFLYERYDGKCLIVVPTTNLVLQMKNDFLDYEDIDDDSDIHIIYSGKDKNSTKILVETEDGKEYMFSGNENIKIINNSVSSIKAKDLTDEHEIDNNWLQKHNSK